MSVEMVTDIILRGTSLNMLCVQEMCVDVNRDCTGPVRRGAILVRATCEVGIILWLYGSKLDLPQMPNFADIRWVVLETNHDGRISLPLCVNFTQCVRSTCSNIDMCVGEASAPLKSGVCACWVSGLDLGDGSDGSDLGDGSSYLDS
jgi:hypothetical protein